MIIKEVSEINSQFGNNAIISYGGFDANINAIPPYITHVPAKRLTNCFNFKEITVTHTQARRCLRALMENIEEYIQTIIPIVKNRKKATIVWRITPILEEEYNIWSGYARLRVLDCDSRRQNYYIE